MDAAIIAFLYREDVYAAMYNDEGRGQEERMEVVQDFRDLKPYLEKRLAFIRESGRALELQEEIDDIEFYLEVMKDILADESHGVDQLRSFIDKIHEMIRKNPLTELPSKRRSLEANNMNEYGDNDRPQSPSPEARGSDSAGNIPLIPSTDTIRGDHDMFRKNPLHAVRPSKLRLSVSSHDFDDNDRRPNPSAETSGSKMDHSKHPTNDDDFVSFDLLVPSEDWYTRRDHSDEDVDMRGGGFYNNTSGTSGRGQRRWSEEGGGGSDYNSGARGVGRGLGIGRGALVPHYRKDDYLQNSRGRGRCNDNGYECRSDFDVNRSHSRADREQRDSEHMTNNPVWLTKGEFSSNRSKFEDCNSQSDRCEVRSHIKKGQQNKVCTTTFSWRSSEDRCPPQQALSMAHGHQHVQPLSNVPGFPGRPLSLYPDAYAPLHSLPVPNTQYAGMGRPNVAQPITPGVSHPMNFQQPPPSSNFPLPEMHPNHPGYRMPPPYAQTRPLYHPQITMSLTPNHPPEPYLEVNSSSHQLMVPTPPAPPLGICSVAQLTAYNVSHTMTSTSASILQPFLHQL